MFIKVRTFYNTIVTFFFSFEHYLNVSANRRIKSYQLSPTKRKTKNIFKKKKKNVSLAGLSTKSSFLPIAFVLKLFGNNVGIKEGLG